MQLRLLSLIFVVLGIGRISYAENFAPPVVQTDCGPVRGATDGSVSYFLGIPYGAPPVGQRRWQNSVTLKAGEKCWSGTLDANNFGAQCAQNSGDSENCLFLNIWTPKTGGSSDPLPVFLFIHGGGFNFGSGAMDGTPFVMESNKSVVVVSINYRLNGFGFMALPQLTANSPTKSSGNYGISDMITALQWVKGNIAAFGGNPKSVTISGQSSGGTGVLMLLMSPLAVGLFHKAILMSGSTRVEMPLAQAHTQNEVFLTNTKCNKAQNPLQCLYALSTDDVLNALPNDEFPYWGHPTDFALPDPTVGDGAMLGIVDGYIITRDVQTALHSGQFSDVPVIFGTLAQEPDLSPADVVINKTASEYKSLITEKFKPFNNASLTAGALSYYSLANYSNLPQLAYDSMSADIHATCGQSYLASLAAAGFRAPVYRYIVTQFPSAPMPWCGHPGDYCPRYAFHTFDMMALFDGFPGGFVKKASDIEFQKTIQKYFLQLARNGTLSAEWPPTNGNGDGHVLSYMFSYPHDTIASDWHREQCDFWWNHGMYDYSWNS